MPLGCLLRALCGSFLLLPARAGWAPSPAGFSTPSNPVAEEGSGVVGEEEESAAATIL